VNEVLADRDLARQVSVQARTCRRGSAGFAEGLVAALVLSSGAIASGCVATATAPPSRAIVVTGPPPAPIAEEPTAQPQPASVWIAGYWHWTGIQYAWIPGHWEAAPRNGAVWLAPRYVKNEGSYIYEPGTWWNGVLAPASGGPAVLAPASGGPAVLAPASGGPPGQANAFR
jgi:hypothetical protein